MFGRRAISRAILASACLVAANAFVATADAGSLTDYQEFTGTIRLESRIFPKSANFEDQRGHATGVVFEPKYYMEADDGMSFSLEGFYRLEGGDPEREHADLRTAYLLMFGDVGESQWELRLGVDRVFWGVTESRHLVDIINQTDFIEHPDEESKLGQPMVHYTLSGDWGIAELFGLPYHRKRTFPGKRGRLRNMFVVDNDRAKYESSSGKRHIDLAARYSHSIGPADFALSVFEGTSREPTLLPDPPQTIPPVRLVPLYEQIRQVSLDAQVIAGSLLLKLEALRRDGMRNKDGMEEDYRSFVAGGEYTFYGVNESDIDVSVLAELMRDGRGRRATNVYQDEWFAAVRVAFNDVESTAFTVAMLDDRDFDTQSVTLQFDRRISDEWTVNLDSIKFLKVDKDDPSYGSRNDDYIALSFAYSF